MNVDITLIEKNLESYASVLSGGDGTITYIVSKKKAKKQYLLNDLLKYTTKK